jgi:ArsR family transcriptional regulator, arsenate/arsenite/antimonite-responsive transcriptional repressor / arsenate reductase (thioredoxin)
MSQTVNNTPKPTQSTQKRRDEMPLLIDLLAHPIRWTMVRALIHGDLRVQELVNLVGEPMNLVSYHLKKLRDGGLVRSQRSQADGRDIYYSLDFQYMQQAANGMMESLYLAPVNQIDYTQITGRVLFICSNNNARSPMAEAILRAIAPNVEVVSAGVQPTALHPDTLRAAQAVGADVRSVQTHSLDDVSNQPFDMIITVCDLARDMIAENIEGNLLHWSIPDPTRITSSVARSLAFTQTAKILQERVQRLAHNMLLKRVGRA